MIGYLKGQIFEFEEGRVILTTTAGVGYQVAVSHRHTYAVGASAEFFIHTHVREDALDLYGFDTRSEKDLFLALLNVNGIGPKGALGILSRVEPAQFIDIVISGDKEALTQVPGIGKKTADRVILEMTDPLKKLIQAGKFHDTVSRNVHKAAASGASAYPMTGTYREAKEALVWLGYKENDIGVTLNHLAQSHQEIHGESEVILKVEELVRAALQRLQK